MKTAKRVLASIIAVLMIVGTCAVAASAAGSLQTQINNYDGVNPVKLNANTTETVTINKDVVIDLNGYRLLGEEGKAAIKITAGNVVVKNGQVVSEYGDLGPFSVANAEQLVEDVKRIFTNSPPAIQITGGSLEVDGVRIVGGMVGIEGNYIPSGSGIQSYNGAPVTLKRTSIYGDYGVNNKVRDNAGGTVTVEDAIILAYTKAIKDNYTVAPGSEEIVAADRISAAFNGGLDATAKELAFNLLDQRTLIVSKTAEKLAAQLGEDYTQIVNKEEGVTTAQIDAPVLDYTWENKGGEGNVVTDCSYKLVPEAISLTDGTFVSLDSNIDKTLVDENSRIRYRVVYLLGDEAKPYVQSLTKEGQENPLDGVVGWAAQYINESYGFAVKPTNDGKINSYDEVVAQLGQLMTTVDEVGNLQLQEGAEWRLADVPMYQEIRKTLYDLAGDTGFYAKGTGYHMTVNAYNTIYGTSVDAVPEIVGTLDRVAALKKQLEEKLGPNLFLNTAAYGDVFAWAVNTVYPELVINEKDEEGNVTKLCILDELSERLNALADLLNGNATFEVPGEGGTTTQIDVDILGMLGGGMQTYIDMINEYIGIIAMIKRGIAAAMRNDDVNYVIDYVQTNSAALAAEIVKVIGMIENYKEFLDPADYIKGDFVNTYCTYGPVKIVNLNKAGNLHVSVVGSGKVEYPIITEKNMIGTIDTEATIKFRDKIKITASTDDPNSEFLYWVNVEGGDGFGYILSTNPTLEWETALNRDVEAVFNETAAPLVTFTNPSGDICGTVTLNPGQTTASTEGLNTPAIGGYGFDGWPNATSDKKSVSLSAANTAYIAGDSAFAGANTFYGEDGATLFVRPNSTSYIVTPKYSRSGSYIVNFVDGHGTHPQVGKLYDVATFTANYTNAYWVDENNEIVGVGKTFSYNIVSNNRTFTAVEGTTSQHTATLTTVVPDANNVLFYVGVSTTKTIKNYGLVYSTNSNDALELGDSSNQVSITYKPNNVFGMSCPKTWLASHGGTLYVRPFVEFANGDVYYGAKTHN